MFCSTFPNF